MNFDVVARHGLEPSRRMSGSTFSIAREPFRAYSAYDYDPLSSSPFQRINSSLRSVFVVGAVSDTLSTRDFC